jgi:hypothetical protein
MTEKAEAAKKTPLTKSEENEPVEQVQRTNTGVKINRERILADDEDAL